MPEYRFPKMGYQRIFTLSKDQIHSFDLNWACPMKTFFTILNKIEIWLRLDPEEIRGNINT